LTGRPLQYLLNCKVFVLMTSKLCPGQAYLDGIWWADEERQADSSGKIKIETGSKIPIWRREVVISQPCIELFHRNLFGK